MGFVQNPNNFGKRKNEALTILNPNVRNQSQSGRHPEFISGSHLQTTDPIE